MTKQDIYDYLKEKEIWHHITEHKAVFDMSEISKLDIPYPEVVAKNLFVRDDKKRNYYLITVRGNKLINLKEFRKKNGTRPLSFSSENELMDVMGLKAGCVTPLGILNDEEIRVKVFMDREFLDAPGLIGIHPNDNTATVWMKVEDLIRIVEEHGNEIEIITLLTL